jgi:hypothetical protein
MSPLNRGRIEDFLAHQLEYLPTFPFQLKSPAVSLLEVLNVQTTPRGRSSIMVEAVIQVSVHGRAVSILTDPATGARALGRNWALRELDFEVSLNATATLKGDGSFTIVPTSAVQRAWQGSVTPRAAVPAEEGQFGDTNTTEP